MIFVPSWHLIVEIKEQSNSSLFAAIYTTNLIYLIETVKVKKLPSTLVTFGGTIKSERISGSPAVAIWMTANEEISSEKNFMMKVLEATEENLRYQEWKN